MRRHVARVDDVAGVFAVVDDAVGAGHAGIGRRAGEDVTRVLHVAELGVDHDAGRARTAPEVGMRVLADRHGAEVAVVDDIGRAERTTGRVDRHRTGAGIGVQAAAAGVAVRTDGAVIDNATFHKAEIEDAGGAGDARHLGVRGDVDAAVGSVGDVGVGAEAGDARSESGTATDRNIGGDAAGVVGPGDGIVTVRQAADIGTKDVGVTVLVAAAGVEVAVVHHRHGSADTEHVNGERVDQAVVGVGIRGDRAVVLEVDSAVVSAGGQHAVGDGHAVGALRVGRGGDVTGVADHGIAVAVAADGIGADRERGAAVAGGAGAYVDGTRVVDLRVVEAGEVIGADRAGVADAVGTDAQAAAVGGDRVSVVGPMH